VALNPKFAQSVAQALANFGFTTLASPTMTAQKSSRKRADVVSVAFNANSVREYPSFVPHP